jgi:hypothetical protein
MVYVEVSFNAVNTFKTLSSIKICKPVDKSIESAVNVSSVPASDLIPNGIIRSSKPFFGKDCIV